MYVLTNEFEIGVLHHLCCCEECVKRRKLEIFINDLEGNYLTVIKLEELYDKDTILAISDDLEIIKDIVIMEAEKGQLITKWLEKEVIKEFE